MNSLQHHYEGQQLYEYLLLLSPSAAISAEIAQVKTLFAAQYGCKNATKSKAHVTLAKFYHFEGNEFRIINCFDRQARITKPITVLLNGYNHFDTHTIFVNVIDQTAITALVKDLKLKFRRILKSTESLKPVFIDRPHLTIARELTEQQYKAAWANWETQVYVSSFIATEMVLMKRAVDPQTLAALGQYKPIQYFSFRSKAKDEQLLLNFLPS